VIDLQSEGAGGGVSSSIVSEDLQRARDELDSSQEEVVQLSENLTSLRSLLSIANEKIKLYENFMKIQQPIGSGGGHTSAASAVIGAVDKATIDLINKTLQDGSNLWKQSKKDETFDLYFAVCKQCQEKVSPDLKTILNQVITANMIPSGASAVVKSLKKGKGVPALRVALEKVLSGVKASSAAAGSVSSATSAAEAKSDFDIKKMKKSLADLEEQEAELNVSESTGGGATESASSSSLLRRAQEAERQVSDLRQKISEMKSRQFAVPDMTSGASEPDSGHEGAMPISSNKKLEGIELRRLQRKIMELEQQLSKKAASGGDVVDTKALAAMEKKFQKQIKELEVAAKKEKSTMEKEKAQLEKTIKTTQTDMASFLKEKDDMLRKINRAEALESEVLDLRVKAERYTALSADYERVSSQLSVISAQLTKESAMRKKYKNELEDLKGNIRVYARCRPFAQYEIERNCKQVVDFVDDTGLKVAGSRGNFINNLE